MAWPIIGAENPGHGAKRDAEKRLTRPCIQQLHVPGEMAGATSFLRAAGTVRGGKPLIHPAQFICLGPRAHSFFEKNAEERRSAGDGGRRAEQTFHPCPPDSERG